MLLPRDDGVLLWLCGCSAPKKAAAEKTFSPEKNNRRKKSERYENGRQQKAGEEFCESEKHKMNVQQTFNWLLRPFFKKRVQGKNRVGLKVHQKCIQKTKFVKFDITVFTKSKSYFCKVLN